MVRNEEKWCQLLSEPGAGSDLASLAMRAVRDGDEWVLTGQKVWTTWAHFSDFAVCLARTDPDAQEARGPHLLHRRPARGRASTCARCATSAARSTSTRSSSTTCGCPTASRIGAVGDGWRVAGSSLAGERQMVSGSGSGGVDRIGGAGADVLVARAQAAGGPTDAVVRQRLMSVYSEERVRDWTNQRVRATVRAGGTPGPAASIGKVHQGTLNQRLQLLAADLLGMDATAWPAGADYPDQMPLEVKGMLRSRANTIEGGTTEVNKNILGERVLGLPREPDPWADKPWEEIPRS